MESQKSDSTGFYAISFEKKCKKYIYINYSHFLKLTSSTLIINFSSRNKLISMDFFFNGESKRLSISGKDEGRKKWRGARVVTQDFHFPWKLLKKKNLAGLCALVRSPKGSRTITHFPNFLRSCTLSNRPSERAKEVQLRKTGNWRRRNDPPSRLSKRDYVESNVHRVISTRI